jgi:hypothetical protein
MYSRPLIALDPPSTRPRGHTMRAAAGLGLPFGGELPRQARVVDGAEVAHRQAQPEAVRRAAGLQQQHAAGRVGAQPVGQHAAGRTGTDDDVVEAAAAGAGSLSP